METLSTKYNSARTTLSACCPECVNAGKTKDTKYHLYIVPNKFAICFRCGYKISYQRLTQIYRIDTSNLKSLPPATINATIANSTNAFQSQLKSNVIDFNDSIYSEAASGYLRKRKVPENIIKRMNIKLGNDKLFGRVVFIDYINNYYVARSFLASVEPKTLNPVGTTRPLMYFEKKNYNALYLVEGTFDMIPFLKTNRDTIALLGKDISQFQLSQLSSVNINNVIVALDVDAFDSAKKLAATIAGRLPMINIGILMYNDKSGKDPADLDLSLFQKTDIHWTRVINKEIIYNV